MAEEEIKCRMEGSASSEPVVVPKELINDGYCDCPFDGGIDEPDTSACSGSTLWTVTREDEGDGNAYIPQFQCPHQPNIILPPSRLYDGICDCCDGADEGGPNTLCPDDCGAILAEQQRKRQAMQDNFTKGYNRRMEELRKFANLIQEVEEEKRKVQEEELGPLKEEIREVHVKAEEDSQKKLLAKRDLFVKLGSGTGDLLGSALSVLTKGEMSSIVVALCQLFGEHPQANALSSAIGMAYEPYIEKPNDGSDSCVALLKAGVDIGYRWEIDGKEASLFELSQADGEDEEGSPGGSFENDDYNENASVLSPYRHTFKVEAERLLETIEAMYRAAEKSQEEADASADDEKGEEEDHSEDQFDDDYSRDEAHDDDYDRDDVGNSDEYPRDDDFSGDDYDDYREDDYHDDYADDDYKADDDYSDDYDDDSHDRDNKDKDRRHRDYKYDRNKDKDKPPAKLPEGVDPMSVNMVKSELTSRKETIERGNKYAKRASWLMEAFVAASLPEESWRSLVVATLWHSRVGAADLAEILYATLPEFALEDGGATSAEGSCPAGDGHGGLFCPARSSTRTGGVSIPPSDIVKVADVRCEERLAKNDGENTCAPPIIHDETEDVEPDAATLAQAIPNDVDDGFYGYYSFVPRTEVMEGGDASNNDGKVDPVSLAFAPLGGEHSDKAEETYRSSVSELERREKDLKKRSSDLEAKLGGKERKYGEDGILHSFEDNCVSIEAGKYDYELCPFGKAHQRDVGQKRGGTFLGNWKGIELDEGTGTPLMKFDGGAKCWNGPKRSASVFVSCGPENKLTSADEPETCQYHFELESYIACDEAYAKEHGLEIPGSTTA